EDGGCAGAGRRISGPRGHDGAGEREAEVFRQAAPSVDVLPAEEQKIFLQNRLNVIRAEALADSAPMLVIYHAGGLIEHFPAALPGEESKVRVFEIKRGEE